MYISFHLDQGGCVYVVVFFFSINVGFFLFWGVAFLVNVYV